MSIPKYKFLLPHQEKFINYTQKKCHNKRGFLLFHFMGTGKTGIALSWMMNYPIKDVYILLPKGIELTWKNEKKNFGIKKKINFITFTKFLNNPYKYKNKIQNNILIIDEAQKICDFFHKSHNLNFKSDIMKILYSSFSTLILSGTPIMYKQTDLSILINICAKKNLLPYDKNTFLKKYGILNKKKSKYIYQLSEECNTYKKIYKEMLVSIFFLKLSSFFSKKKKGSGGKKIKNIGISTISKIIAIGGPSIYSGINKLKYQNLKKEIRTFDFENFYDYDYKKINKETSKYISYYTIEENSQQKEFNSKQIKQIKEIIEYDYNLEQNIAILELATKNISRKTIKILNIIEKEDFNSLGKTLDNYLHFGKMCSNVNKFYSELIINKIKINYNNEKGFFIDEAYYPKITTKISRSNLQNLNKKFEFIIKQILKHNKKTMIYSNFYKEGFKIISVILNYLQIEHFIVDKTQTVRKRRKIVNKFNNEKNNIKVILLHPDIYEGISLIGVNFLHILEPISITIIKDQLIARCIRHKSHSIVKQNDRFIKIYDHVFQQAILISGKRYELKEEIKVIREIKNNKKIEEKFHRIKNNNIEQTSSLWNNHKIKYLLVLIDYLFLTSRDFISTNLLNNKKSKYIHFQESDSMLQEEAKNITGKNAKLLKHLDEINKSNNSRNKIFSLYNHMIVPTNTKRNLLLNPDHHDFLIYEKNKKNITSILNTLSKKDLSTINDSECLKRKCDIWTPLSEGNCYELN